MKNFAPLAITAAAVGFPARLCVITRMDGNIYRIAESDEPVTIGGHSYAVVPGLHISAVKHTSNGEMPSCEIVALHERGATFDTADLDAGFFDAAAVQIYVVDRLNLTGTPGLLFTGSIGNIAYTAENQVTLDVKGPAAFARIVMTQKRSPMCRTDLFSELCGVDKTAYDVATTVGALVDNFRFTVSGVANPDGWFNQGVLVTESGTATEIANWSQSTQTITTYLPCSRILSEGMTLTLYPGCDKTLGPNGCQKYNNQLNFQGEPHFTGVAAAAQQV